MRVLYLLFILLLFYLAALVEGCSLFKRVSRSNSALNQSSSKQLEADRLIWKNAHKETQVFTYWNDSGIYQFQRIKEQVAVAKSARVSADEKHKLKTSVGNRQSEPIKHWFFLAILAGLMGYYLIYKKWLLR